MHQIHNSVHTFHISLAVTHREKLCHKALSYQRTINKIVPSVCTATHTLCGTAASYWHAALAWAAWLQHEWRWTHRWNDEQNCASAPVVTWPIRKSQSCMLSAFPSEVYRRDDEVTVHIGERDRWPLPHIIDQIILSFFGISYRQPSMPKDLTLSKNKCLPISFARSAH